MSFVLALSTQVTVALGGVLLIVGTFSLIVSRRFGVALGLYVVYLGALDGYLKLSTGSEVVTLLRTVFLAALVAASLIALLTDRRRAAVPPGTLLIVGLVLIALVQIANPGNPNLVKPLGSLRQEIEFIPLFFLGYATVRDGASLQKLLLLLVGLAVVNGLASLVQYTISAEQFASWGPGYRDRIFGVDGVSGRIFDDGSRTGRARPFGLGTDAGSGGLVGLLGAGAAVALFVRPRVDFLGSASLVRGLVVGAAPFVLLAVALSLTRQVVVATVIALLVQAVLTARRQLLPLIVVGGAAFAAGGFILSAATSGSGGGDGLARFADITPGRLLMTTRDQRGDSLALAATYATKYPFGAGLGGVGPSTGYKGLVRPEEKLNGETQFNVTLLDLGVPGMVLLLAIVAATVSRIRRILTIDDPVVHAQLAALAGGFVGATSLFVTGAPLTGAPIAPFFWGTAGVLAFWLVPAQRRGREAYSSA